MTANPNPADAVREALDDDEDDDMPRCACCLGPRWPEEMNPGDLCDDCYVYDEEEL